MIGLLSMYTLSFLCVYLLPANQRSKLNLVAFSIFVAAHHVVSLINTNFIILPGADYDAHYFHLNALRALEHGRIPVFTIGTGVYEWLIYSLYTVFGSSKLLAQTFNITFVAICGALVCRIGTQVESRISYILVLGILTVSPSILFFTSITFREVFQLTGFVGGCYFFFSALERNQVKWLVLMFLSLMFMGAFHHVLLILGVFLSLAALVVYAIRSRRNTNTDGARIVTVGIGILVLGILTILLFPASNGNDYLEMLRHSGSVPNMIEQYRQAVDSANPRSSYGFIVDTSSTTGALSSLFQSYMFYLLGFWPGAETKLLDLVPLVGGFIRFCGIGCFFYLVITRQINFKSWILFLLFIGMSLTWSLGTTNFGQAFRHNVLTDWIPVLWIALVFTRSRWPNVEK